MDEHKRRPSSREEPVRAVGEELTDRAPTSLINANVAIPVNAELAADVLSNSADAGAHGPQDASSRQPNERPVNR
jgi:hypothetical protein